MTVPTTSDITNPVSMGYGLRIGTQLFQTLDLASGVMVDTPAPQQAPKLTENPEDVLPESGQSWSRADFGGGEGLWRAHRRDGTERDYSRFWTSENLDVSPPAVEVDARDPAELQLAREFELIDADLNRFAIMVDNDRIITADYTTAKPKTVKVTGLQNTIPTQTTVHDPLSAITSGNFGGYAFDGAATVLSGWLENNGGLLTGRVYYSTDYGDTWAEHTNVTNNPIFVWSAKGRLFYVHSSGLDGWGLYEVVSLGDDTQDVLVDEFKLPPVEMIDIGTGILVCTSDGRMYTYVSAAGDLVLDATMETPLFGEREVVWSAAHYGGIVLLGTGVVTHTGNGAYIGRLWRMEVQGSQLVNGQLLKTWGVPHETIDVDYRPVSMVVARNSIWVLARHGMPISSADERSVWRYDLTTGGLSHWAYIADDSGVADEANVILSDGNQLWVQLFDQGLYRETDLYSASGELHTANVDHFSGDEKSWLTMAAEVDVTAAGLGANIDIYYSIEPEAVGNPNSSSWTLINSYTSDDDGSTEYEILASGVNPVSRYIALRIVFGAKTDKTATPALRWVRIRSYGTQDDVTIEVPVNVSDWVPRPNRRAKRVPGHGSDVWTALKALEGTTVELERYRPSEKVRGRVERVAMLPAASTRLGGSVSPVALVRVTGQRFT